MILMYNSGVKATLVTIFLCKGKERENKRKGGREERKKEGKEMPCKPFID